MNPAEVVIWCLILQVVCVLIDFTRKNKKY